VRSPLSVVSSLVKCQRQTDETTAALALLYYALDLDALALLRRQPNKRLCKLCCQRIKSCVYIYMIYIYIFN